MGHSVAIASDTARRAPQPMPPRLANGAKAHVLIVDDHEMNQILLRNVMEAIGVSTISVASNGLACLEFLARHGVPDLILLDVMMPEMDGYETCRRIRAHDEWRDVTVVIQTALQSPEDRLKAFAAGASDFVSKPYFTAELIARLKVHLENGLMTRSLQEFRARLTEQLLFAAQMQTAIMPEQAVIKRELAEIGLEFDALYRPADQVGGDLWQVKVLDRRYIAISLFDLTGHGLVAAINAFRVQSLFSKLDAHKLDPETWLTAFNAQLAHEFRSTVLATGFYGVLDVETGVFRYASAGWMPPLLGHTRADGFTFEPLPSSGIILGMISDECYAARSCVLEPGDALLLYSDGLCLDLGSREIEPARFLDAVTTTVNNSLVDVPGRLLGRLPSRVICEDDVMALWLHRTTTEIPEIKGVAE